MSAEPVIPRFGSDTGDTPKRGKPPKGWRRAFLQTLAETCNVRAAAKSAGVGRKTAYRHRQSDPRFAEAWDDAIEDATDLLEGEARRSRDRGDGQAGLLQGPAGREHQGFIPIGS